MPHVYTIIFCYHCRVTFSSLYPRLYPATCPPVMSVVLSVLGKWEVKQRLQTNRKLIQRTTEHAGERDNFMHYGFYCRMVGVMPRQHFCSSSKWLNLVNKQTVTYSHLFLNIFPHVGYVKLYVQCLPMQFLYMPMLEQKQTKFEVNVFPYVW